MLMSRGVIAPVIVYVSLVIFFFCLCNVGDIGKLSASRSDVNYVASFQTILGFDADLRIVLVGSRGTN